MNYKNVPSFIFWWSCADDDAKDQPPGRPKRVRKQNKFYTENSAANSTTPRQRRRTLSSQNCLSEIHNCKQYGQEKETKHKSPAQRPQSEVDTGISTQKQVEMSDADFGKPSNLLQLKHKASKTNQRQFQSTELRLIALLAENWTLLKNCHCWWTRLSWTSWCIS